MADFTETFNRTLLEFIDDLIVTFPELGDFEGFKKITNACVMIDPQTPYKIFHKSVTVPYADYILHKNEFFFLNETYRVRSDPSIVDRLKLVWKTLDAANKEIIWNYMRVLVALDKKCGGY